MNAPTTLEVQSLSTRGADEKRAAVNAALSILRDAGIPAQVADYRWLNGGSPMTAIVMPGVDLARRE